MQPVGAAASMVSREADSVLCRRGPVLPEFDGAAVWSGGAVLWNECSRYKSGGNSVFGRRGRPMSPGKNWAAPPDGTAVQKDRPAVPDFPTGQPDRLFSRRSPLPTETCSGNDIRPPMQPPAASNIEERGLFRKARSPPGTGQTPAPENPVPRLSCSTATKAPEPSGEDKYTTRESERLMRLPMYYGLTLAQVDEICDSVKDFFG